MFDKINKIPAGLFLVPLLLSALLYTTSHNFVRIGDLTEATFSSDGLTFILGAICFCSGTGIDLKRLLVVLKRQGIDLIEAAKSGFVAILLVIIYYIFMSPIYFTDKKILKKDGIAGLSMMSIAGISVSTPLLLAQSYPELLPYVASATGQLLTAVVISSIVTSFLVKRLYNNVYQS